MSTTSDINRSAQDSSRLGIADKGYLSVNLADETDFEKSLDVSGNSPTPYEQNLVSKLQSDFFDEAASDPAKLTDALHQAFGDKASAEQISQLASRIISGHVPMPTSIEFVNAGTLGSNVSGVYVAESGGRILLDGSLLNDPAKLERVFIEELGHHFDTTLGGAESAGDEGAIFAESLQNGELDAARLKTLRSENDAGVITLNGRTVAVEQFYGGTSVSSSGTSYSGPGSSPGTGGSSPSVASSSSTSSYSGPGSSPGTGGSSPSGASSSSTSSYSGPGSSPGTGGSSTSSSGSRSAPSYSGPGSSPGTGGSSPSVASSSSTSSYSGPGSSPGTGGSSPSSSGSRSAPSYSGPGSSPDTGGSSPSSSSSSSTSSYTGPGSSPETGGSSESSSGSRSAPSYSGPGSSPETGGSSASSLRSTPSYSGPGSSPATGGYPAFSPSSLQSFFGPDLSPEAGEDDDAVPSVVAGVVGANNGLYARAEGLALTELDIHVNTVIDEGLGNRATVGAVVVDNTNFDVATGINTRTQPVDLHPVLRDRVDNLYEEARHPSRPGTHAEVNALNTAIHNREAATGRPFTEADLPSMTVASAWTRGSNPGGMFAGDTAPQCANCAQITVNTHNISGVSTRGYQKPDNSPGAETAPRYAYQDTDIAGARRGGATGGIAAAGMSTVQALSDGRITSDEAARIATDTATGVVAGAGGEVIENVTGRAVERAASNGATSGLSQTTRVVGSRVAGAGAAGAVIGAGFATFDQVGAYQRGEVTASEAIGTVTAEAATGLAAGASGAAAGAAIGSIIPGAGTVVGGVIGFGVGMGVGYLADKGLRAAGVTDALASGVTSTIDAAGDVVGAVSDGVSSAFDAGTDAVSGALSSAGEKLGSLFGW